MRRAESDAARCLVPMFMPPVKAWSLSTTRILRWLRKFTENVGGSKLGGRKRATRMPARRNARLIRGQE